MKTIRNKIFAGLLFLFIVIVTLSALGIIFISRIAEGSKGTIKDNYSSVSYAVNMLSSLDEMFSIQSEIIRGKNFTTSDSVLNNSLSSARKDFEENLNAETRTITEPGEGEIVTQLQSHYKEYINTFISAYKTREELTPDDLAQLREDFDAVKSSIVLIYDLNMNAILRRNKAAEETADKVIIYMLIIGTISILATLSFIFNFPSRIVKPINILTGKIKAISERNYDQQLNINSKDEIGELAKAFNIMAVRLKEYENKHIDEILLEKKRMEALVQNMQDGIILLDEEKKIVIANRVITELIGIKEEDLYGKYAPDIATHNDLLRELIKGLLKPNDESEESIDKKPIRIVREKKESFYNHEVIPVLANGTEGNLPQNIGYMIILKNITQFEERDVAKTNLIATISHEMKTPISSINLTLRLLEDQRLGSLSPEQKELVQSIRLQSNRLSKVVNEILDYSQIETGNIRLRFSEVHPEDVVDYAATALMIMLSEKKIQLETEIEDNIPRINADLEKAVWVLMNLLSNAIRYSKEGGKIILKVNSEGNSVRFSVKDFGPGISPEDKEKLFKRFSQVGQRSKQGWGLGLAISKEFVQAQGGKIWVESEEGSGSIFIFTLPVS